MKKLSPLEAHIKKSTNMLVGHLKNPGFKKAYDDIELEFSIISAFIRARIKSGLTQANLAKLIGTTQSAIARFENGHANPTLAFIKRVSDALHVDIKISVR